MEERDPLCQYRVTIRVEVEATSHVVAPASKTQEEVESMAMEYARQAYHIIESANLYIKDVELLP